MNPHDATFWAIGALAAFLVGVAKTGVPGMGILVVPIVAMIFPAKQSVGALLPLLVCGDIAGVVARLADDDGGGPAMDAHGVADRGGEFNHARTLARTRLVSKDWKFTG